MGLVFISMLGYVSISGTRDFDVIPALGSVSLSVSPINKRFIVPRFIARNHEHTCIEELPISV
jgi:hypothetical protein